LFALASVARELADRLEGGEGVQWGELPGWSALANCLAAALEDATPDLEDRQWSSLLGALYPPTSTH
jgi:hypothetical protein